MDTTIVSWISARSASFFQLGKKVRDSDALDELNRDSVWEYLQHMIGAGRPIASPLPGCSAARHHNPSFRLTPQKICSSTAAVAAASDSSRTLDQGISQAEHIRMVRAWRIVREADRLYSMHSRL